MGDSSSAGGAGAAGARRRLVPWIACGLAGMAAAVAAAPFDLRISRAFAALGDPVGAFFQDHGTRPALVLYLAAIAWLAVPALRRRSVDLSRAASAVLVQALVHTMFLTNLLKALWGRARYDGVAAGHAAFDSLFSPEPLSGGMSFPSGHVATALVLLPAAYVFARSGRGRIAAALVIGSAIFAAATGAARIRFGAHYLSDVLFSAGGAALMAPVSVALGDRYLALFERAGKRLTTR